MEDAAVMTRLVGRELGLLLEDRDPQPRSAFLETKGGRKPDDPAAHDQDVVPLGQIDSAEGRSPTSNGTPNRSPRSVRLRAWTASMTTPRSAARPSASAS